MASGSSALRRETCWRRMAIRATSHGPADAEQQQRAMQDPEIQGILADPMIRNVLNNFQENPKQAQEDMKDPGVVRATHYKRIGHSYACCQARPAAQSLNRRAWVQAAKLNKLIAAGVLKTG
jgi:hypothetical protein